MFPFSKNIFKQYLLTEIRNAIKMQTAFQGDADMVYVLLKW